VVAQVPELLDTLDALGDDVEVEAVRHRDDGEHEGSV